MVRVSAIVVTWNSESTVGTCLRSLRAEGGEDIEIIVVDNASGDDTQGVVHRKDPRALVIRNTVNVGFAAAVNVGLRASRGGEILVLNPDAALAPGALAALRKGLGADASIGMVGPALVRPSGRLDYHAARNIPRLADFVFEGLFLTSILGWLPPFDRYLMGRWDHATARRVPCLSGACLLVKREVYERIGGMDERFFLFFEDVEWCARAGRRGHALLYEPAARAEHLAHRSIQQDAFRSHLCLIESARVFYEQCVFEKSAVVVDLALAIVTAFRSVVYGLAWLFPRRGSRWRGLAGAYGRLCLLVLGNFARRPVPARPQ
jgi:hypothetical protein